MRHTIERFIARVGRPFLHIAKADSTVSISLGWQFSDPEPDDDEHSHVVVDRKWIRWSIGATSTKS